MTKRNTREIILEEDIKNCEVFFDISSYPIKLIDYK